MDTWMYVDEWVNVEYLDRCGWTCGYMDVSGFKLRWL
jgi:hypothetical protein